jgi:hypothetical protein
MEGAWAGGWDKRDVLSYFPKVVNMGFNFKDTRDNGTDRAPLDDFAIAVDGVWVVDYQRGGDQVKGAEVIRGTKKGPLYVGAWVEVFTYDSNLYNSTHCRWTIDVTYEDGISRKIEGGGNDKWGDAFGESTRKTYYTNGFFLIPPPANWPWPKFFPTSLHQPKKSTRYDSLPRSNPLY